MNTNSSSSATNTEVGDTSPNGTNVSSGIASKAGEYVSQTVDAAHENIARLSAAAHPGIEQMTARAHGAVDAMERTANRTVDTIADATDNAAEIANKIRGTRQLALDSVCEHVRKAPLMAVVIAAGAGYLFGRILRDR